MEKEQYPATSFWLGDMTDDDNEKESDRDAQTFRNIPSSRERCWKGHSTLKDDVYEGFSVLYCTTCEQRLCPDCKHPALEAFKSDTASGIYCKQCGKESKHSHR